MTARARAAGYGASAAAPARSAGGDSDSDGGFELVPDKWDEAEAPWLSGDAARSDRRCYVVWGAVNPVSPVLPGVYVGPSTCIWEHLLAAAGSQTKLRWRRVHQGPKEARRLYKEEQAHHSRRFPGLPREPALYCL